VDCPLDIGPGVKNYKIDFEGVATSTAITSKKAYTLTLSPYPKNATITILVTAQGPRGASQTGEATGVTVRTPRR